MATQKTYLRNNKKIYQTIIFPMLSRCPLFQYILTMCDAGDTEAILPLIALRKDEKDLSSWTEVAYLSSAASILLYYWIIWKIWQFLIKSSSWNFFVGDKVYLRGYAGLLRNYVTLWVFQGIRNFSFAGSCVSNESLFWSLS